MSDIYKMKLHDRIGLPDQMFYGYITRVASGWIYTYCNTDPTTGYSFVTNSVFVPFDNHFMMDDKKGDEG